jgi:hypothetical protein
MRRCKGVCSDRSRPSVSASRSTPEQTVCGDRSVTLTLESFAWEAIDEEAARGGTTIEELIAFSVIYYLADVDSGRISREIARSPYTRALNSRADAANRGPEKLSGRPITDRR